MTDFIISPNQKHRQRNDAFNEEVKTIYRVSPEHGAAAPVFRSGELLQKEFKCKLPDFEHTASNSMNASLPVTFYVNGFVGSKDYYDPSIQKIADTMGSHVLGVINNQESSIVVDLQKALAGRLHHALGEKAEKKAVTNLKECILDFHENFPDKDIRILAYSQGTIITKNSIELLRKEIPEEDWLSLSRKLKVELYGAAQHLWPSDVSVVEYMHKKDYVPGLTQIPDTVRHAFQSGEIRGSPFKTIQAKGVIDQISFVRVPSSTNGVIKTPEMIVLDTQRENAHDIQGYMDSQSIFFIALSGDPSCAKGINTLEVAERLSKSIKYASYSDQVHDGVISKLSHDHDFAKKLLENAPHGNIDKYQIPEELFSKLLGSAADSNSLNHASKHIILPRRP